MVAGATFGQGGIMALPSFGRVFDVVLSPWLISISAVAALGVNAYQCGMPFYRQTISIREIEEAGGRVVTQPGGPDWLKSWLRDERLRMLDVPHVAHLDRTSFTDRQMRSLARLTSLEGVDLRATRVTDLGLSLIRTLEHLSYLDLDATDISDDGLVHLKGQSELEFLFLNDTRISDAGLFHLKGLPRLRELHLANCPVTETGIADLKRALPGLDVRTR